MLSFWKTQVLNSNLTKCEISLTLQDVGKIYKYIPECEQESMAKDFWVFSYLANGMNCKDIAFLKYKNIEG